MGVGSINIWGDAARFNMLHKGANCKLLVHSDTTDGSTTFADSSGTSKSVTAGGSAQHDTAQIRTYLGKTSILFDGTGDYLTTADHADFNFGTGALTMDFWVRFYSVASISTLYYQSGANDDRVWFFVDHLLGKICLQVVASNAVVTSQVITWAPLVNTWYHIALIRGWGGTASSWSVCVNGSSIGTFTANITMPDLSGTARFGGGLSSTDLYDFGPNAHVMIFNEDPGLSADQKKFGTMSFNIPGTADHYIYCADSADWELSTTTNYTVDFWLMLTTHAGVSALMQQSEDATNYWVLAHTHGQGFRFIQNQAGFIIDTGAGAAGEITSGTPAWHHVALVKVSTVYTIYVDGARVVTTTDASTDTLTGPLLIGAMNDNSVWSYLDGYMDEIRISASDVLSSGGGATCTVPTTVPAVDANTKLLLRTEGTDLAGWMTEIRVVKGTAMWTKNFSVPIGKYI